MGKKDADQFTTVELELTVQYHELTWEAMPDHE